MATNAEKRLDLVEVYAGDFRRAMRDRNDTAAKDIAEAIVVQAALLLQDMRVEVYFKAMRDKDVEWAEFLKEAREHKGAEEQKEPFK